MTTALTAVVVGMAAFVVMLPDHKTHLVSKRIALGQIVIIYVVAYDKGGETDPVMHPVHVAASTAIGVLACVLALLLPYPGLATCQVIKPPKFDIPRFCLYHRKFTIDKYALDKNLCCDYKNPKPFFFSC